MRKDGSFGAATSNFNPYGENQAISFDLNIASQFDKPHFRSRPKVGFIRPPADLPFDGTSFNGVLVGVGLVGVAIIVYLLGKKQKWWK